MLMKFLVSAFERARSKLTVARSDERVRSDSHIKISNIDSKFNRQNESSGAFIIQRQPRLSLSKWLCSTPIITNRSISSSKSNKVRRTSSWRSLKEHTNNSIASRTFSVDELHRNSKKSRNIQQQDPSPSSLIDATHCSQKLPNDTANYSHFDRLSSTLVNYSNSHKASQRRDSQKQFEQQMLLTLSQRSTECDSGYSEENFATKSYKRSLHTSCPHCHCEQRSSFDNYKKLRNNSSTESSPSDIVIKNEIRKSSDTDCYNNENVFASQSYPYIKSIAKTNIQAQQKLTRTLLEKRRRNLSCDSSLWMRTQTQKPITLTASPVFSESNHLSLQRHFKTIDMKYFHPVATYEKLNSNVFGELNLAAIERDSLRTSVSSSSSSISMNNEKIHQKRKYLVWHEYKNSSLLSATNGTSIFSVIRGDQVHLLERIGKSTLLVQKETDGSIGFLPQSCLAYHEINSFLSLKGLKETVL